MAEIALDGVSKTFPDGTVAIRRADFTIVDGEFFVLVGPSGCGKSTLLNMIVGLEDVSEGTIRVDGEIINDMDPKDRNMAMVFQSYALYPHMSVRENMAFPLKLAKRPRDEISRRVAHAAQTLQLTELLDRKPSGLSGGQKQRVAMGRAIVRKPRAFLLDEPLSNLDARLRVQMRTEMARLHKRLGATMVYVTHDQTEAMTLGERIAILREGVVQQIGAPRELYDEPGNLFVAGFIGSPSMNFLPARLGGGRVHLPMVEFPLPELWRHLGERTGRVIAGIRPEHIEHAASSDSDGPTFQVKVDVREWMGHELDVYFPVGDAGDPVDDDLVRHLEKNTENTGRLMCARLSADSPAAPGSLLELRIRPEKLHLFDPETGSRLRRVSA